MSESNAKLTLDRQACTYRNSKQNALRAGVLEDYWFVSRTRLSCCLAEKQAERPKDLVPGPTSYNNRKLIHVSI